MKNILCYGDSNSWGFIPGGYNSEAMLGQRYPHSVRWLTILNKLLGSDYHVIEENLNGRNTSFDETPANRPSRNGLATVSSIDSVHIDEHGQPIVAKAVAEKILAMKI